jgi:plastocyanin
VTVLRRALCGIAVLGAGGLALLGGIVSTAGGAASRPARTVSVTVGDDFFRPSSLSVRRGTRVRWTWRGRDAHNVTVTSGPRRFNSPTQRRGTFMRTLRARGTYRIVCTVHGQRMRIRVR